MFSLLCNLVTPVAAWNLNISSLDQNPKRKRERRIVKVLNLIESAKSGQ
jgi:hypothetical protein